MSEPRDWDKELAAIDKVMARGPVAGGGGAAPSPAERGGGAPARIGGASGGARFGTLTTWLRVLLGLVLAVAITQWPYKTACGFNLAMYLGAIATVVVAGLWSAVSSWQRRLGLAHLLSLGVLGWGLVLGAREILPRTGYAREVRTWTCTTEVEAR